MTRNSDRCRRNSTTPIVGGEGVGGEESGEGRGGRVVTGRVFGTGKRVVWKEGGGEEGEKAQGKDRRPGSHAVCLFNVICFS